MKRGTRSNRNSGFTMVEGLAVVAILVILMGVTMVSVARHKDSLKLVELDNAARDIFMAAENRAVLLSGEQQLSDLVKKAPGKEITDVLTTNEHTSDESLYYVYKKDSTAAGLLTVGAIDPTLLKGDFLIVYDLNSGSPTDLFYI